MADSKTKIVNGAQPVNGSHTLTEPKAKVNGNQTTDAKTKPVNGSQVTDTSTKTVNGNQTTDPKTKTVNGNQTADPKTKLTNGNDVQKKANKSKLWQMLALAQDVAKEAEAVQDFEKSLEDRKALEQELEARKADVETLREFNAKMMRDLSEVKEQANSEKNLLMAGFEQRFKAYDQGKTSVEAMEKEVEDAKEKLAAAEAKEKSSHERVDKIQQKLQSADRHAASLSGEVKEMNAECEMHRSRMQTGIVELDACKTKLAEAKTDLGDGLLHDYGPDGLRTLGLDLKALSKKCHNLVLDYFNDLDGAKDSASEIQELKTRFPDVPLTTATTKSAAQMRCAVAEAVIAEVLTTQIFVPFYLANGTKEAASSLLSIFGEDEKRRSIYRCQILQSMKNQEEVTRVEDEIVGKAIKEVRTTLHPLVVAHKTASFYNAIPVFFRDALKLWAAVQRSRELITAEPPDLNEVQPPSKYDEYDGVGGAAKATKATSSSKPSIAAVFFPQVATREDLIFNGMVMWSNQAALLAAAQEVVSPVNGAHSANGESAKYFGARRRSIVAPESPLKGRNRNGL